MATLLMTPRYIEEHAEEIASIWAQSVKSERAKKAHVATNKKAQEDAESQEARIAKRLGGTWSRGNDPVDIVLEVGGKTHGIELKVMRNNTNDKITVGTEPNSEDRKKDWARSHGAKLHTIVVDRRGGRHDYYYRVGIGNSRLGGMDKCASLDEVKRRIR